MKRIKARAAGTRPSLVLFIWLIVLWVILWGELSWGNLIAGIAVALLVGFVISMPRLPVERLSFNWAAMVRLFGSWGIDFVVASFEVAWLALRRSSPPPSAIIRVPMRTDEDFTLATAMALINLQPGGIIVDVDRQAHLLTMHILDASSPSKIDKTVNQLTRMERRVIRAFEDREVEYSTIDYPAARTGRTESAN